MRKFILSVSIFLMALIMMAGCGSGGATSEKSEISLKSLTLTTTGISLLVGENYSLPGTGTAVYSDGSSKSITVIWDKSVNTTTAGKIVYTASYTENSVKVTAIFTIEALEKQDATPKLMIEDVKTTLDGIVEITINATGFINKITGIDIRVKTDPTYLTFDSGIFLSNMAGNMSIIKKDSSDSSIAMGATVTSATGENLSGNFLTFKFKAVKKGITTIKLQLADVLDLNSNKVPGIDISDSATITIE